MFEAFFDTGFTPAHVDLSLVGGAGLAFELFGVVDEDFGGVGAAVEDDVFDLFEHVLGDFLVNFEHAGVDDAHVHAGLDGVVEEHAVHGLADLVVAAEAEADVADATADFGVGEVLLDPAGGVDEVESVVVVLFESGGDGEDVGVEDDVFGREVDLVDEDAVGAFADADLLFVGGGLALLVKGHDDGGGAVLLDFDGAFFELFLAFLEGDGVDDAFALEAFEAGLNDFPLGGIDHDGDLVHLWLGLEEDEKLGHHGDAVDEAFVHADVDDIGAAFDLLAGDGDGFFEFVFLDELSEFRRASDVGALPDHEVVGAGRQHVGLGAAEAHGLVVGGDDAGREAFDGFGDGGDVFGGVAAAAAHDVDEATGREVGGVGGHVRREEVEAGGGEGIGHARVGVGGDEAVGLGGEFGEEGPHFVRAEGAIEADGERLHVAHGIEVGLGDLTGDHGFATGTDGGADLHGEFEVVLFEDLADGDEGGFGVEGVEDGFDHEGIDTTGDESADLVFVGGFDLVEGDVAEAKVGEVRELREGDGEGTDGTGDIAFATGLLTDLVGPFAALPGGLEIDFPSEVIEELVFEDFLEEVGVFAAAFGDFFEELRLGDAGAGEGVGFDEVGTGFEETAVDVLNDVRAGDGEDVAVVEEVFFVREEARASGVGFREAVAADGGAHSAINDEDALAHGGFEFGAAIGTSRHVKGG